MQKYPLLPVAVMLVTGIITGYTLGETVGVGAWMTAAAVTVIAAISLWRYYLPQSIMIYIACFLTAGFLVAEERAKVDIPVPDTPYVYEAVVASVPVEHARTYSCDIILTSEERPIKVRAYIYKDDRSARLNTGSGIKAVSLLKASGAYHDEPTYKGAGYDGGHFDYEHYLISHGISATTFIGSQWQRAQADIMRLSVIERARLNALRLRNRLLRQYAEQGLQGQTLALVSALTLGDRSLLSSETREDYMLSGASHILALSGLHLTIIFAILTLLMGRYRRHVAAVLFTSVCVWLFVFIAGTSPSLTRAALMVTIYNFCSLLNRDRLSFNTLAFAAIALLIVNPLSLYDVGFQLSFTAMLSIGLFFRPFLSVIPPALLRFRVSGYLISVTLLSVSAQIGTMPLAAYYFGRTPVYSIVTNIVAVLGATVILFGAVVFFITSPLQTIRTYVADALSFVAETMNTAIGRIASWPAADILSFRPSLVQTILIYIAIAAAYMLGRLLHRVYGKKTRVRQTGLAE